MAGPIRWFLFFAVIVLAAAGVTALWVGWSEAMLKGVASFAIVALAFLSLWALTARRQ